MTDSPVPDLSAVASPPPQSLTYEDLQVSADPIGGGGQAVVYEATVSGAGERSRIALKEPRYPKTLTRAAYEAFLSEAEMWQMIDRRERENPRWDDYEHIVGVIDTSDTNLPWIGMEYMDGGNLRDRLHTAPNGLPIAESLWIGECLCRGLEIADEYGYSHLDVTPKNVLFRHTPAGKWDVPKLADWGIARVLAEETGTMDAFSPKYAAPEQFEPSTYGDPDSLTDLYQAGAVVYTMLTGKPPYTGSSMNIKREVLLGDVPTPPSQLREGLSETADTVVTTALARQKADRYRNLTEFEQALRALRTDGRLPSIIAQQVDTRPSATQPTPTDGDTRSVQPAVTENKTSNRATKTESTTTTNPPTRDSWSQFQGGPARTGYRSTVSAPKPPVDEQWCFETDNRIHSSPVVADGTVFVVSDHSSLRKGYLYALDGTTGNKQWCFETDNRIRSSPAVADGTVFIGSLDTLYAVDTTTGNERWHFKTDESIYSSPAVADGTVFVGSDGYGSIYSPKLYAVAAATGDKQWHFETDGDIESSPAVGDGTVFVGCNDNNLYAVDAATGDKQWHFETDRPIESSPAVTDGTVFIGSTDHNLYAVDVATGDEQWHFETHDWIESSPAVADGTVFVGSWDGNLYAVDATTGIKEWRFETDHSIKSSPAVAANTVLIGSWDANLYSIYKATGKKQWMFKTNDSIDSSPAVADGTVFVGSWDHALYAISGRKQ